ncbi:MAG TPA: hypothetical protein PLC40_12965 [Candidatus Hydrogenedentes bacterium]|nr:hypothetical protein [Candidatus Hydrogenedentota bacterium]
MLKSARKKPSCWRKANKDKERRSGILPLCIKTDMRAAVTMEAAGCRFYDLAIPYVRIQGMRRFLNVEESCGMIACSLIIVNKPGQ